MVFLEMFLEPLIMATPPIPPTFSAQQHEDEEDDNDDEDEELDEEKEKEKDEDDEDEEEDDLIQSLRSSCS
jgi:ribosomal protein L12E/L44/L45/RPP1/RPP2